MIRQNVAWTALIDGATEVRERLRAMRLESFVKTTGGKGLHVVVPLTPKADWETVKTLAQGLAEAMAKDSPSKYTATISKRARGGKIYLDYLRNGRGATAVAAYSTRARAGAPVFDTARLGRTFSREPTEPLHGRTRLRHLGSDPWDDIHFSEAVAAADCEGHKPALISI